MSQPSAETRLCLVIDAGPHAEQRLQAALAAVRAACVIIRAPAAGPALRALVALAQRHDAAALIEGDVRFARELAADGVHLPWTPALEAGYADARAALGRNSIVGTDAGGSRHDAMLLGEAGADYIAFGNSNAGAEADDAAALAEIGADGPAGRRELVGWWAETFEVPVLALDVATADDAATLADVGADFVGVTIAPGLPLDEIGRELARIEAAIAAPDRD